MNGLLYKPDKVCCLTGCPICGRYFSNCELPNLEFYECICSKRKCFECSSNPMLSCPHGCGDFPISSQRSARTRIRNYVRTRLREQRYGENTRKMLNVEKRNILRDLLEEMETVNKHD